MNMTRATGPLQIMALLLTMAGLAASAAEQSPPPWAVFEVKAFGAVGDGLVKDTAAIQNALDACAAAGGGTVYIAPGTYLCGSLHLRTGVTLWLDAGATIKGSEDNNDYDPYEELGFENDSDSETLLFPLLRLIWGEDVERIASWPGNHRRQPYENAAGPKPIALNAAATSTSRESPS